MATEITAHYQSRGEWLLHQVWFIPAATVLYLGFIYLLGKFGVLSPEFVNNIFKYISALLPF